MCRLARIAATIPSTRLRPSSIQAYYYISPIVRHQVQRWAGEFMANIITSDIVTDRDERFPIHDLLKCEYFKKYRHGYYAARDAGLLNRYRNSVTLLQYLSDIHTYN